MKSIAKKMLCLAVFLCAIFLAFAAGGSGEDLLRVVVLDFANKTGDQSFDTPCATVSDNLNLTLRLLGSYQVERPDALPPSLDDQGLLEWCESNFIDYVLFGSVSLGKNDTQKYELSVFSREKKRTAIRKDYSGSSVFDAFAASDELTVSVLSSLTGRHISFGSLVFKSVGKRGSYDVVLDGISLAENAQSVDRVTSGSHKLVVYEKFNGIRTKVLDSDIAVKEGESTGVSFELKGVAPFGELAVSLVSPGDVFVDGGLIGSASAPLSSFGNIPEGEHSVEIRYKDGKSEFAKAEIVAGATQTVSFSRVVDEVSFGKAKYAWSLVAPASVTFEGRTYSDQPILSLGSPGFGEFAQAAKLTLRNDPSFRSLADSYSTRVTIDKTAAIVGVLGMIGSFVFTTTSVPYAIETRSTDRFVTGGIAFAGSALLTSLSFLDFSISHGPGKLIKYINARATK